ncbi:MAG: NUDIX domain-containing protein [Pseudomonadota bacterium]
MTPIFLFGTLRHPPLLDIVAGPVAAQPARLPGYGAFHAGDAPWPILAESDGAAEGVLIPGDAQPRLDFYMGPHGRTLRPVTVQTDAGPVDARAYGPSDKAAPLAGPAWNLQDWVAEWGAITLHAAEEAMGYFGVINAETLGQRIHTIRARAWARVNASSGAQQALLGPLPSIPADVIDERRPYTNFFSLMEADLRIPRFAGGHGPVVTRASLIGFDAVVVLPYDPVRDRVLLIEQYRMAPHFRRDPNCFLIEAPAGGIDAGEAPEAAAARELQEEVGVHAQELHLASSNYSTTAAMTEFLHIYVAIADLPDGTAGLGGLETEDEDIRSKIVDYQRFEEMLDDDGIKVGPLVIAGLWLARHRERLRTRPQAPGQ